MTYTHKVIVMYRCGYCNHKNVRTISAPIDYELYQSNCDICRHHEFIPTP